MKATIDKTQLTGYVVTEMKYSNNKGMQQNEIQKQDGLGGKSNIQGILQETKIWSCWQMRYALSEIGPRTRDASSFLAISQTNRSSKQKSS